VVHYWHVLDRLVRIWQSNGDWSHGFIIPFFSLYYLYVRRDSLPRGVEDHSIVSRVAGAMLLLAAFYLYAYSALRQIDYPKNIALMTSILGVVLMVCGWPVTRWSWFAIAFLIFAMPLPVGVYQQMTWPLREIAAKVSALVLSAVPDMVAEAQRTVVQYVYRGEPGTLDIERACSGMRLLMTMTALGVAMTFVNERPIWQRMIMILACVPIAIFCNIIRVLTTGFFVVFGREDLARGMPHTLLGLGMLAIAFALYATISYILNHLFVEDETDEEDLIVARGVTS
jgi:exosortase